ncbi:MAG: hypothetical protein Q9190_007985 [Brigantiaea leucoxantha]
MESLQGEYYWPNMRDQVKQYIRDCLPCQRLEANRQDQRTQRRITRQEIEREWEVERIVDSRHVGRNKRLQYRVQWVGWPHGDGTWYNTDRDEFGHAEELAIGYVTQNHMVAYMAAPCFSAIRFPPPIWYVRQPAAGGHVQADAELAELAAKRAAEDELRILDEDNTAALFGEAGSNPFARETNKTTLVKTR